MSKFMSVHTLPPGGFSRKQLDKLAQAAQQDPTVQGYRSFVNLSEGKALCVFEAPSQESMAEWFQKMGMPYDSITRVELEGDRGLIEDV